MTDEKLNSLCENQLKKRTFAKMKWAVQAYTEWHNAKLAEPLTYDYRIYE